MATDDDAMRELTWSGRRRREFLMARWRTITAVALATAAAIVGGPWAWRWFNPELNLSNTPELALDVWAQRREIEPAWRACDDRDPTADGWHLCRMQVGDAPAVEIWCAGDLVLPERRECTFERAPRMPRGWSPLDLPGASVGNWGTLEGTMANPKNTQHPSADTTITTPGKGPIGAPMGPDPTLPPEAGGQAPTGGSRPDQVGADAGRNRTPAGPARTGQNGEALTDEKTGDAAERQADRARSGR